MELATRWLVIGSWAGQGGLKSLFWGVLGATPKPVSGWHMCTESKRHMGALHGPVGGVGGANPPLIPCSNGTSKVHVRSAIRCWGVYTAQATCSKGLAAGAWACVLALQLTKRQDEHGAHPATSIGLNLGRCLVHARVHHVYGYAGRHPDIHLGHGLVVEHGPHAGQTRGDPLVHTRQTLSLRSARAQVGARSLQ